MRVGWGGVFCSRVTGEDNTWLEGVSEPWGFLEEEHSKLREQQVQSPLTCSEKERCVGMPEGTWEQRRKRNVIREVTEAESCRTSQASRQFGSLWLQRKGRASGATRWEMTAARTRVTMIQVARYGWSLEAFWKYVQWNVLENWIWRGKERGESRDLQEEPLQPVSELSDPTKLPEFLSKTTLPKRWVPRPRPGPLPLPLNPVLKYPFSFLTSPPSPPPTT